MRNRVYEYLYPSAGDIVIIFIEKLKDIGAYVQLLEFNNLQGMILTREISRKKMNSIHKSVILYKDEPAVITKVDGKRGYVDVSKCRIAQEEIYQMKKKWVYAKNTISIATHVSRCNHLNCEDLQIRWGWPFCRKYKHMLKGVKKSIKNYKKVLHGLNMSCLEFIKIREILKKKMVKQHYSVFIEFEIFIFSKNAIDFIKKFFEYQLCLCDIKIEIKLITFPCFSFSLLDQGKKLIVKEISYFLKSLLKYIQIKNGNLYIKNITFKQK
ncbi:translational initiation factor 2 alpha SU (nucleomorph) [Cryptomonas paramecium]|uniref:Translational initiation factor 2 alpha SU n=1 Tax=Cryptomonas paramaecium TaxID=2898 RepID=F2HH96_9CRYP|nr:translational initiation factor 2 alpha SU [Cryptomonas paramecium]AEA38692.1 translational initiation factor 2 alpha SU [Cryptomonas paramecium]|mmetsp:Transcript_4383/g.12917  ORF Transcript_4383/g.12917 Transcript_4383/m.12917 type:complete len:268 (+) Transcript_4383:6121-6924(+)